MCGIIGYVGDKEASPILLEGLKKLEYRGYDSAGMATIYDEDIMILKDVGRIKEIQRKHDFLKLKGSVGIAHTRWATHGKIEKKNAHPHTSCHGEVAVVHNGIIQNYKELRESLIENGHKFKSETDSEVLAHLIESAYLQSQDVKKSILTSVAQIDGSYSFVVAFRDQQDLIAGARGDLPLIIGVGNSENFLASDAVAFVEFTDRAIFLDYDEAVIIRKNDLEIFTFNGTSVDKKPTHVAWEASILSKEFAHYTLKEIHEQAETMGRSLLQDERSLRQFIDSINGAKRVYIIGSGTSYHAGMLAKYLLATYAKIPVEVIIASEFSQYEKMVDEKTIIIAISQSGETADLLHAVRLAHNSGGLILSIVNAAGSSLVRESSLSLFLKCGPEIGVAATKSFTSQLMVIIKLILGLTKNRKILDEIRETPKLVREVLKNEDKIKEVVEKYKSNNDFYFLGRAMHYPIALEGALKMKELSYIHAEGIAAGELKHGTLALISNGTPVIVINPEDDTYIDTLNNVSEVKTRGANVIGISTKPSDIYDDFIPIPKCNPILFPTLEVIPLQMLAYYAAIQRQQDPDYPRNLAKSVTVK